MKKYIFLQKVVVMIMLFLILKCNSTQGLDFLSTIINEPIENQEELFEEAKQQFLKLQELFIDMSLPFAPPKLAKYEDLTVYLVKEQVAKSGFPLVNVTAFVDDYFNSYDMDFSIPVRFYEFHNKHTLHAYDPTKEIDPEIKKKRIKVILEAGEDPENYDFREFDPDKYGNDEWVTSSTIIKKAEDIFEELNTNNYNFTTPSVIMHQYKRSHTHPDCYYGRLRIINGVIDHRDGYYVSFSGYDGSIISLGLYDINTHIPPEPKLTKEQCLEKAYQFLRKKWWDKFIKQFDKRQRVKFEELKREVLRSYLVLAYETKTTWKEGMKSDYENPILCWRFYIYFDTPFGKAIEAISVNALNGKIFLDEYFGFEVLNKKEAFSHITENGGFEPPY